MCGACCSNLGPDQSVLLQKDDISIIAATEKTTNEDIISRYCDMNPYLSKIAGKTIFQLKNIDGRCIFLNDKKKCSIHHYKPNQCTIGPDRFMPRIMKNDYECMIGIEVPENDDQTERFFSKLMET
jgi:Fe-S-cluster containining protein